MFRKNENLYSATVLFETIIIKSDDFVKEEIINPAIRLLGPQLFRNTGMSCDLTTLITQISNKLDLDNHTLHIYFDLKSMLWVFVVEKNNWHLEATILYPIVEEFLRFADIFFNYLHSIDKYPNPFHAEILLRNLFPYKLYYLVNHNRSIARFSRHILDTVLATKIDPLTAIKRVVESRPPVIGRNFSMEKIDDDLLLTYLTMRSILPAYLLPPLDRIDSFLADKLMKFLKELYQVEVLPLESIDDIFSFLSLIRNKIEQRKPQLHI